MRSLLLAAVLAISGVQASKWPLTIPRPAAAPTVPVDFDLPVTSRNGTQLPPYNFVFNFSQLIDHNDPSKGTFVQRYFFTYEWYEAGGPITLFTPGEAAFDPYSGYLTNRTIPGRVAQLTNGASIVLEHRFFGLSNPAPDLSAKSLQLHTLDQAVEDLVYFAKNVKLSMPSGDQVGPDKAPWLLIGGSYSGALTGWTMQHRPGVFWAGYASSAVVEAINYYWGYFEPIRQHMPQNCSADIEAVLTHVDKVLSNGTPEQQAQLKAVFNMGNVTHNDDAAGALRNNLWDWQSLSPTSGPGAQFFKFCDALEVKDGVSAPTQGWGLDRALAAWGAYWSNTYMPLICGKTNAQDCLGSYDTTQEFWTDTSLNQDFRSWFWMVCNQVGFFQDGAPVGWPSIVTRLVTPIYDERQCAQYWPDFFNAAKPPVPNAAATNREFQGWAMNVNRLFFANGNQDPWREATTSSDFHPRTGTESQPIFTSNGFHCSDLITSGAVDPTVGAVIDLGVAYMGRWVNEWRAAHPDVPAVSAFNLPDPDTLTKPPAFVPLNIPQRIVNAPPPPLPKSVTDSPTTGPKKSSKVKHIVPNAWAKSFGKAQ